MKKLVTIVCTGMIAFAALQAPEARAGDREWATAGKILTGVVATGILLNGFPFVSNDRHVVVHETRVVRTPPPRPVCVVPARPHYPRPHYQAGPPRMHPHGGPVAPKPGHGCGAIIHQTSRNRRIYQVRVHGHKALIQERPHAGHAWMTVGECPSIW